MKRIMLLFITVSTFMVAQDAVGSYKLTGVDVLYTYVSREAVSLTATDAYGLGITQELAAIPSNVPFNSQAMTLTSGGLSAVGINLNVQLNSDGSGSIAAGSYYPDVNTIYDDDGNCVTLQQVLPVTDDFTYESNGNMMADNNIAHPGVNVLGIPGISSHAGQQIGGLGLSGSLTFEDYPVVPTNPTICAPQDAGGDCITLALSADAVFPGGTPLAGYSGGFFLDSSCEEDADGNVLSPGDAGANCNSGPLTSVVPGNSIDPDFYLEWHGVDGASSGLGYGEDYDVDENGGGWFDRQLGIPGVTATYFNNSAACGGFSKPIYGDVRDAFTQAYGAEWVAGCVDTVASAASAYLMDPSGALANWSNFLTAKSAQFSQCVTGAMTQGMDATGASTYCGTTYPFLMTNDSDHELAIDLDIDQDGEADIPTCMADCLPDGSNAATCVADCSGRLAMDFDIPCVPIVEAREVIAEFIEVGGEGCGTGDMDNSTGFNVVDVVALVNLVLTGECGENSQCMEDHCAGDLDGNGALNVLDVVALVNIIMGNRSNVEEASSAIFNVNENEVTMNADGYVGGVQMTLSHAKGFELTLTDGGQFSGHLTKETSTTLVIVNPSSNNLFSTNSEFTIESVIATADGSEYINTSIADVVDYTIGEAYPNPFNPSTQLSITLNSTADVSVKVFNMNGQLIDVIASGQMSSGSYNFTWNAANTSSGVYFIQTEIGSDIHNQKIMFVK